MNNIDLNNYEVIDCNYGLKTERYGNEIYLLNNTSNRYVPSLKEVDNNFKEVIKAEFTDNLFIDLNDDFKTYIYIKKDLEEKQKHKMKMQLSKFLLNLDMYINISEAKYFVDIFNDDNLNSIYDNISKIDYTILTIAPQSELKRLIILVKKIHGKKKFLFNGKKEIIINRVFYQSTGTSRHGFSVRDHFIAIEGHVRSGQIAKTEAYISCINADKLKYEFSFYMKYIFHNIYKSNFNIDRKIVNIYYNDYTNYNKSFEVNNKNYMNIGNIYKNIKNEKERAITMLSDLNKYKRFFNPLLGAISKYLYNNKENLLLYFDIHEFLESEIETHNPSIKLQFKDKSVNNPKFEKLILESLNYKTNNAIYHTDIIDSNNYKTSLCLNYINLIDEKGGYSRVNTLLQTLKDKYFTKMLSSNNDSFPSKYKILIDKIFSGNLVLEPKRKLTRTTSITNKTTLPINRTNRRFSLSNSRTKKLTSSNSSNTSNTSNTRRKPKTRKSRTSRTSNNL